MLNKNSLVFAVVLAISALGSALKCYKCGYTSKDPKAAQKCGNETVDCNTGYCESGTVIGKDGTFVVERGCGNVDPDNKECPNAQELCDKAVEKLGLKSCAAFCCTTDLCNNYTPSSATDVVAAKFTLCVMVIAGFLFA